MLLYSLTINCQETTNEMNFFSTIFFHVNSTLKLLNTYGKFLFLNENTVLSHSWQKKREFLMKESRKSKMIWLFFPPCATPQPMDSERVRSRSLPLPWRPWPGTAGNCLCSSQSVLPLLHYCKDIVQAFTFFPPSLVCTRRCFSLSFALYSSYLGCHYLIQVSMTHQWKCRLLLEAFG